VPQEGPVIHYGHPAPGFSLPSTSDRPIALADFKGKAEVVLLFYCYDWGRI
jgi:peroxiredoxin